MSAEIIELGLHKPHISGKATCAACRHKWIAVAPVGTAWFECPGCGSHKGLMMHECLPDRSSLFTCNCGCDVFCIDQKGTMCINCGSRQNF